MPDITERVPTAGDAQAAFQRIMDLPARSATPRLADALVLRDWIHYALLTLRCLHDSQTRGCPLQHVEQVVSRLVDDRRTTGRAQEDRPARVGHPPEDQS
jgi:aminoglycoside phosphotransferase